MPVPQEAGAVFFDNAAKRLNGLLHGFLKFDGRRKRLVGFDFHDVQLQFFAKRELGQLYEVDGSPTAGFDDLVANRHRL